MPETTPDPVPSPAPKESGGVGATSEPQMRRALAVAREYGISVQDAAFALENLTLAEFAEKHKVDLGRLLPIAEPTPEAVEEFLLTPKAEPLPGRWGHQHSAPIPEGLAGLGARGQEPLTPGPTLAEVQAERDYERERANEAIAQLHDAQRELAALRGRVADGGKVVKG